MARLNRCPIVLALVVSILIPMISSYSQAAEATARVDVNSAYVWRGITYNDGLVVQPSIDVASPVGIGINVWGNLNIDDYDGAYEENEFSEVDINVTYGLTAGPVDMTFGYAEYLYPHTADEAGTGAAPGTREFYTSAEMEIIGGLGGKVLVSYDADEVEGFYASVGLSYGMEIIEKKLSAELGASAGCADKDWAVGNAGGTESGLSDYNVTASVAYCPIETIELGANLGYTDSLDEDVLPEQDVDLYGGVSVSVSF